MSLHVGDTWKLVVLVTPPESETPTEPSSIVGTVRKPSGHEETPSATKISTGKYEFATPVTEAGPWITNVTTTTPNASQPFQTQVKEKFEP